MRNRGFTPGPWWTSDHPLAFSDETGAWEIAPEGGENWVAKVLTEADAHLIAAAPELYDALVVLVECLESPDKRYEKTLKPARDALRKARGEVDQSPAKPPDGGAQSNHEE